MDGHGYPGPRHHMPATGNGMVLMSEAKRAEANGRLGHELLMSSSGRALCCVMLCVLSCVCYVFCMLNMPSCAVRLQAELREGQARKLACPNIRPVM